MLLSSSSIIRPMKRKQFLKVQTLSAAGGASMVAAAPSQQATRHARRIYVGGLPPTANEQNIATFFSNALAAVGGTTAGPGISCTQIFTFFRCLFILMHALLEISQQLPDKQVVPDS